MPFEEYPYLKIEPGKCLALSNDECEVLIAKQKKIYADLAQKHGLDVADLTREFLRKFSTDQSGNFTKTQKIFLKSMIVATGIKEKDEDLEDKDIFRLMAQIGNSEKLKEWYEKSKSILDINDSLIAAARNGHMPCVAYLVAECGAQISNHVKGVALMSAASNGHAECVAYLIEKCRARNLNDYKGDALKLAAEDGHLRCVVYLIEKCGPQISDDVKGDALKKAASNGHAECVEHLIKKCGAQISDESKGAALENAARNGHLPCVEYLIKQCGEQILRQSKEGALVDAGRNNHMPCMVYLIKNCGAEILDKLKGDVLVFLASKGHAEYVAYLIEKYNQQIPHKFKDDALKKAASNGYAECVAYLIEKCGPQISDDVKGDALKKAAENGYAECVAYLIKECGTESLVQDKGLALSYAASNGHLRCVAYLIKECGTQISDDFKGRALIWAAWRGRAKCVEYLIKACGAQIKNDFKIDALLSAVKANRAVKGNYKEVVKILIRIPDFVISEAPLNKVLSEAIHCRDHDIIHLLALQNIGNEKPSNGNRYKIEDGKGWRFGMTEPLRRTLEQERYQQLKDDSSYYIAYSQYSTFIDEKLKEKPSEDLIFLKYFELFPPELQEKTLSYVYCSPLSYTPEQWKKTRTFGDIYLSITWPSLQLDQKNSMQLDQQNSILFSYMPTNRRKRRLLFETSEPSEKIKKTEEEKQSLSTSKP